MVLCRLLVVPKKILVVFSSGEAGALATGTILWAKSWATRWATPTTYFLVVKHTRYSPPTGPAAPILERKASTTHESTWPARLSNGSNGRTAPSSAQTPYKRSRNSNKETGRRYRSTAAAISSRLY